MLLAQIVFQPSCTAATYAVRIPGSGLTFDKKYTTVERCSFDTSMGATEGYQIKFTSKASLNKAYAELAKMYKNIMRVENRVSR